MPLPNELGRRLSDLEAELPAMIAAYPEEGEFWMAFAGEADVIEDQAGEHAALVNERIARMLARHGRFLRSFEIQAS